MSADTQYVVCPIVPSSPYDCAGCEEPIAIDPVTVAQGKIGVCSVCAPTLRAVAAGAAAPAARDDDDDDDDVDDGDDLWDDDDE